MRAIVWFGGVVLSAFLFAFWNAGAFAGQITAGSKARITGGTINNTTLGLTIPAAAKVTTITSTVGYRANAGASSDTIPFSAIASNAGDYSYIVELKNPLATTTGRAYYLASSGPAGSDSTYLMTRGSLYTASGLQNSSQGSLLFTGANGILINANAPLASAVVDIATGGSAVTDIVARFTRTGHRTLLGTITDDGVHKLQVAGDAIFTGGIAGTATNDNAAVGHVGEQVESIVVAGSAVSLTTGTTTNITSISLTSGDWEVYGIVAYHGSGTTLINDVTQGSSSTSATVGALGTYESDYLQITPATSPDSIYTAPHHRYSLAATTTIYLVALPHFTVSTLTGYGVISARRVR